MKLCFMGDSGMRQDVTTCLDKTIDSLVNDGNNSPDKSCG